MSALPQRPSDRTPSVPPPHPPQFPNRERSHPSLERNTGAGPSTTPQSIYWKVPTPEQVPSQRPIHGSPPPPRPKPLHDQPQSTSGPVRKRQKSKPTSAATPPLAHVAESSKVAKSAVDPPAVLTREKKQKACSNCRKAKLKCIVGEDQSDCVRCLARKEKCVFYPRNLDDDWQQVMAQDVYAGLAHLSDMSSAVNHLITHLSVQGIIPPFHTSRGTPLDRYEAPERDLSAMQGWDAERNREIGTEGRRRTVRDDTEEVKEGASILPTYIASPINPPQHNQERSVEQRQPVRQRSSDQPSRNFSNELPPLYNLPISTSQHHPQLDLGPSLNGQTRSTPKNDIMISPTVSSFGGHPNHSNQQILRFEPGPPPPVDRSSSASYIGHLVSPDCMLGEKDPRKDVIKDGMVSPEDAVVLVNHSHHHLSPFLFGYQLEFGYFPYLPGGPQEITPLILAVHCLLASERIPHLFHLHRPLADAAHKLLLDSPAGSWRTVMDMQAAVAEGSLFLGEDDIDPEMGIGPEEIVATAMLSLWMSEKDDSAAFARMAFRYARGWIRVLLQPEPRNTLAELSGIVTQERVASDQQRSRVWLLCYLADGIANSTNGPTSEPIHDPTHHISVLIPFPTSSMPPNVDKRDLVLTSHARLLQIFYDWQRNDAMLSDQRPNLTQDLQRLAATSDLQIDEVLNTVHNLVPDHWPSVKQLEIFGLYIKTTIFSQLNSLPSLSNRQRATNVARTVDVGMEMLEKCSNWSLVTSLANVPQQYLTMMWVIGHAVTDFVVFAAQSTTPTGCSVTPREASIVLNQLIGQLSSVGLQKGHNVWVCVDSFGKLSARLEQL